MGEDEGKSGRYELAADDDPNWGGGKDQMVHAAGRQQRRGDSYPPVLTKRAQSVHLDRRAETCAGITTSGKQRTANREPPALQIAKQAWARAKRWEGGLDLGSK